MPAWLAPLVTGVLSTAGGLLSNQQQRASADRAMRFSERMSSTAAQRSAKDYAAAGLNPALAYDRPASSPSGVVAGVDDVVSKGVSSAMAAKRQQADLRLLDAQSEKAEAEAVKAKAEATLISSSGGGKPSWFDEQLAARDARMRDFRFQGAMQPHDLRLRELDALIREFDLPANFGRKWGDRLQSVISRGSRDVGRGVGAVASSAQTAKAWLEAFRAAAREKVNRNPAKVGLLPPAQQYMLRKWSR